MKIKKVYLHDLLWEEDKEGFCYRIDQYLDIAASLGLKTMFVFFEDCWQQDAFLGKQPDPTPGEHNPYWVQSPGANVVNDPSQWGRLEDYVKGILERYKNDDRVVIWDLYNEPGNGMSGDDTSDLAKQCERSLPLLKQVFRWAREVEGIQQPFTSAVWIYTEAFKNLSKFAIENSDIITFHSYAPPQELCDRLKELQLNQRPIICTEYLARGVGCSFEHSLPIMKKYKVGAINWGLVSGKTQTIYPWGWKKEMGEPELYFHDIFHKDGAST